MERGRNASARVHVHVHAHAELVPSGKMFIHHVASRWDEMSVGCGSYSLDRLLKSSSCDVRGGQRTWRELKHEARSQHGGVG